MGRELADGWAVGCTYLGGWICGWLDEIWMDGCVGGRWVKAEEFTWFLTTRAKLYSCDTVPHGAVNCQGDPQRKLWWPWGPTCSQQTLSLFTPSCILLLCLSRTGSVTSHGTWPLWCFSRQGFVIWSWISLSLPPQLVSWAICDTGVLLSANSIPTASLTFHWWIFTFSYQPRSKGCALNSSGFLYSPLIPSTIWYRFQPHFLEPREGLGALLALQCNSPSSLKIQHHPPDCSQVLAPPLAVINLILFPSFYAPHSVRILLYNKKAEYRRVLFWSATDQWRKTPER